MALFKCRSCRRTYRTQRSEAGRRYECPACQGPLDPFEATGPAGRPTAAEMPAEAKEAASDPARRLGRFVVVRDLGRGGMGVVHQAWDTQLGRWVAIKLLLPGAADAEDLVRFRQEASVVASLDHPNIAPIHDVIEAGDRIAIVMKLVEGRTLEEMFLGKPGGPAPIVVAVRIVRDACLGVGYAHTRGFVHRDLKPGNLMVDRENRVFVLDFGLAKVLSRSEVLTDLGRMMGTPAFMSPEQAMGLARDVDARSDVFSLGATLWTLLAGVRPFQGRSDLEVARAIVRDPTPSVRAKRPEVSKELDLVLQKAMTKEREGRFPTAVELATALDDCLVHEEEVRESRARSQPIAKPGAPATVLLIEDDPRVVTLVRKGLEEEGLRVLHFGEGELALKSAEGVKPGLVLLDVNLPDLIGWEILRRLRSLPSCEKVPILMVTGEGGEESIVRGYQLGADDYIVKPFSVAVLRARVRRHLDRHSAGA